MIWLWLVGAAILAAAALTPPLLVRRRASAREFVTARDRARSAMSRLEWALDADPEQLPALSHPPAVEAARRCQLLAGSALAGPERTDAFRRAAVWAAQGLQSLGLAPDTDSDVSN